MQQRTLADVVVQCGAGAIVALGEVSLASPPAPAHPGAEADVAIGRVETSSLGDVTEQLRAASKVGGTVLLVAAHGGVLGKLGSARRAPELTAMTEALLAGGFVELSAALTPGTLRRELLVWGTLRER